MLKNLTIVLCVLAAMSLSQWLLISFISRNVGVGALGTFSFSLSTVTPMIAILGLGFRWLIVTEPDYSAKLIILVTTRAILLGVICPIVLVALSIAMDNVTILAMTLAILVAKIAEALADICYGKAHRDDRFALHGLSVILRVVLGGAGFYWLFTATASVPIALLGIALAWFAVLFAFDLPRARDLSATLDPRGLRLLEEASRFIGPAILRGWPLSVSSGVGAVALGMSNYTLMYFWGAELVGHYAAFFSFVIILNLGAIAFGQVALPVLTRLYRGGQVRAFFMALAVPLAVLLLGVCAISFGFSLYAEPILTVLFGPQIAAHAALLAPFILFCAPVVLSQFMQYVLTSTTSYHYLLAASLVSLATALVASLLLVPRGGLQGAMHVLFAMGAAHVAVSLGMLTFLLGHQSRRPKKSDVA